MSHAVVGTHHHTSIFTFIIFEQINYVRRDNCVVDPGLRCPRKNRGNAQMRKRERIVWGVLCHFMRTFFSNDCFFKFI